jgi:hypothetical protein
MSSDFFHGHEVDEVLGFFILKKPIKKDMVYLSLDFYKKLRPFVGRVNYNIDFNFKNKSKTHVIIGSAYSLEQIKGDHRIITLNTRKNWLGYYGPKNTYETQLKLKQYNVQPGFGKFAENLDAEIYNLMLIPSLDLYTFKVLPFFLIEIFLSIFSVKIGVKNGLFDQTDSYRYFSQDDVKFLNDRLNSLSKKESVIIPIGETTKFYRFLCFLSGSLTNLAINPVDIFEFLDNIKLAQSNYKVGFNPILELSILYQYQILEELHENKINNSRLNISNKSELEYIKFFKNTL